MYDHNSHEYMRARQRKTRDVNFEFQLLYCVELLIVSEASF